MLEQKQNIIKNIKNSFLKKKKRCSAMVLAFGGKILLLKRSNLDDFHPSTYCLPGGGLTEYENPLQGCKREVMEESGLSDDLYDVEYNWLVKLKDVDIYYFYATVISEDVLKQVVLDNTEHYNYIWVTSKEIRKMDLILDLKQHLIDKKII